MNLPNPSAYSAYSAVTTSTPDRLNCHPCSAPNPCGDPPIRSTHPVRSEGRAPRVRHRLFHRHSKASCHSALRSNGSFNTPRTTGGTSSASPRLDCLLISPRPRITRPSSRAPASRALRSAHPNREPRHPREPSTTPTPPRIPYSAVNPHPQYEFPRSPQGFRSEHGFPEPQSTIRPESTR